MTDYEHNTPSLNQAAGAAEKGGLLLPPPTNICNSVSYKHLQPSVVFRTLLHTATTRVGRVCCIVLAAAALLALASCGKESRTGSEEEFNRHPTWTDNDSNAFWDKSAAAGLMIDPSWAGDTIIYF